LKKLRLFDDLVESILPFVHGGAHFLDGMAIVDRRCTLLGMAENTLDDMRWRELSNVRGCRTS
jgi:hypothetical protein